MRNGTFPAPEAQRRKRHTNLTWVIAALVISASLSIFALRAPSSPNVLELSLEQQGVVDEFISVLQFDKDLCSTREWNQGRRTRHHRWSQWFQHRRWRGRSGHRRVRGEASRTGLARFIEPIRLLAAEHSEDLTKLDGFADEWRKAAQDRAFRIAQDRVNFNLYIKPALERLHALDLRTALGFVVLYDTVIQQGTGQNGIDPIIQAATARAHGRPVDGVAEETWLRAFLDAREAVLLAPPDPRLVRTWVGSVGRVRALRGSLTAKTPHYVRRWPSTPMEPFMSFSHLSEPPTSKPHRTHGSGPTRNRRNLGHPPLGLTAR